VRLLAGSLALAAAATAFVATAALAADAPCATPSDDGDWPVATPAAAGFDADALCAVLERAATEPANLHGLLVERHGKLVAELYRIGRDQPIDAHYGLGTPFAPAVAFDAETLHDVRSISKSVVGLLIGLAVHDGKIGSLGTPVLDSFPELADLRTQGRDAITIENLLTMSSGLEWNEWNASTITSDETRLFWKRDPVRWFFDRPLAHPPGTVFNYAGGGTATLAQLLVRATGKPLVELARAQLFEPLGITRWVWATDLRDRPLAFAGLRLRPRDMAKLGRLVLDGGRWRGREVVPAAWIAESTRAHIETGVPFLSGYGYQWWAGKIEWRGRELPWSAGVGNGGQRIFVVPELDLTVVTTAGEYGSAAIGPVVGHLFGGVVAAVAE
jgi:CubicO group peptidase (beta-lactamase class C family)